MENPKDPPVEPQKFSRLKGAERPQPLSMEARDEQKEASKSSRNSIKK